MRSSSVYPFRVFANQNLGTQFDYTAFAGEWLDAKATGHFPVLPEINLATGNVILKSTLVKTQEQIGNWEFGFLYNAQNATPWSMNIPGIITSNSTQLIFQEKDGSQVTYTLVAGTQNTYVAPSGSHSKSLITIQTDGSYIQLDPATGERTFYNAAGQITAMYDARGCGMQYTYVDGILSTITSAAGVYTISTANSVTSLTFVATGETTSQTLGTWTFDSSNRLQTATIPDANNYAVNYTYNDTTNQLTSVTQTDGTTLGLTYTTDNPAKIQTVQQGVNGAYTFAYNTSNTTITDALGFVTTATFNAENTISSWQQQVGDTAATAATLITTCNYHANGDLKNITKPNTAQTQFTFNAQGLITEKTKPSGQVTQYDYDTSTFARIIKRELQSGSGDSAVFATTRYVYHNNVRQIPGATLPCRDLRFVVSPKGCVNESRYDDNGILESKRTYLQNAYKDSALTPTTPITFAKAKKWSAEQTLSAISLSTMHENLRGQRTSLKQFANINIDGTGNDDEFSSHDQYTNHTLWGVSQTHVEKMDVQNSKDVTATTQDAFDGLHRLTSHQNALSNTKTIQYNDTAQNAVATEYNGRTETSTWDTAGQVTTVSTSITISGKTLTRVKTNNFDTVGRVSAITGIDGQIIYQLFDSKNRPRFVITPKGCVTEYFYDDVNQYSRKTRYYTATPINTLTTPPPTFAWITANLTKNAKKDVSTYSVYDLSNRLQFEVAGNGRVTGYNYDLQNRPYLTTTYKTKISKTEIAAIATGTFSRTPTTMDCVLATFYDDDNHIKATQDGDNYVTQYQRTVAGVENCRTQFATQVAQNLTGTPVYPAANSEKDFSQYLYSDARGQHTLTVDGVTGANYVVQQSFYPNGKPKTETKFANQTSIAPSSDSNPEKLIPVSNTEDQVTTNVYDLLNHLVQKNLPQQRLHSWQFDSMGNVILICMGDDPAFYPDAQTHGTAKQFDDWGQLTAEATPLVYAKITAIKNNPKLTPAEIATQVAAVWSDQALRYAYDNTTGLMTSKTDITPDGQTQLAITYFYYNLDGRLVLKVGPDGQASQTTPHPLFDKPESQTRYEAAIAVASLPTTDGFINPAITALITENATLDQTEQYEYDGAGNEEKHTDAEGYVTQNHTDMLGNNDQTQLPVNGTTPSLIIDRTFDFRHHATQEVKTAAGVAEPITTSKTFNNLHGNCTSITDGNGSTTTLTHEPRGVLLTSTDANDNTITLAHDAFKRETLQQLPMGQQTAYVYTQETRQITTNQLDSSAEHAVLSSTSKIEDAFGNVITNQDAEGNTAQSFFNAANQCEMTIDPNDNQYKQDHDLRGLPIKTNFRQSDPTLFSSTTTLDYTLSRELKDETKDTTGLNLKTTHEVNALGQNHQTTKPNGNIRKTIFDRRSLAIEYHKFLTKDTAVITAQNYTGLKTSSALSHHTHGQTHVYQEQFISDGFGRESQRIVDPVTAANPDALALAHTKKLDNVNRLIASIDPKGQTSYLVRDAVGNVRFEINPKGGVTEHQYNAVNKPIFTAQYVNVVATGSLTVGMSIAEVQSLLKTSNVDRHTYYFYDDYFNERFRVNRAGAVVESRYNLKKEEIATVQYYTAITGDPTSLTTEKLITQCAAIRNTTLDKASFRVLDPAGQEVFIINADGSVIQKCYHSTKHKVNHEIQYVTKITNPESTAALSIAEITKLLTISPDDRQTYWLVDGLQRLQFYVTSSGAVTRYDYDGDTNNRIKVTEFKAAVTLPPTSYSALQTILNNLAPNSTVDNIEKRTYDGAEREITRTNGLENSESFGYDGASRRSSHATLSGNKWTYDYDGASRLRYEYSPATTTYSASIDPANVSTIKIESNTAESVAKETHYDRNSNITEIISGVGLEDEHRVSFGCDELDLKNLDTWNNVPIDDPTQAASLTVRPETVQSVDKKMVRGAHGQKLIEFNEAGNPTFYSYDAQNELKYKVNAKGYVFEYQRNCFGQCEHFISYATPLTITLSDYFKTGLTADVVVTNLVPNTAADRSFNQVFDQNGRVTTITRDKVVCYIPDPSQNAPTVSNQIPTKQITYNAFGEAIATSDVVDEKNNIFRQTLKWYDQSGNEIAIVDANGKAIVYTYDLRNRKIGEYTYANFIPAAQLPTNSTTFSALQTLLIAIADTTRDHEKIFQRDAIGNIIAEINTGVVTQIPVPGKQAFTDAPPEDLSVNYTFTDDNKIKTITYPDGQVKVRYYDERRFLIAEADVVRTQADGKTQIRPITYYHVSSDGKTVETFKPACGCAIDINPDVLPLPATTSSQDHYLRFMHDPRGHLLVKQDQNNNLQQMTHTLTGKIARSFKPTTNPNPTAAEPNQTVTNIDENRKTYDELDRVKLSSIYRDAILGSQRENQYDAFNLIGEGPGDGTFPNQYQFDQAGRKWSTVDSKGSVQLIGRNAAGEETVTIESGSLAVNLANTNYSDLETVMQKKRDDVANYEFLETVRDEGGRPNAFVEPGYPDPNNSNNIIRPVYGLELSAFNKKTKTTKPSGDATTFTHNKLNKLATLTKPASEVMDVSGNTSTVSAVATYGCNKSGGKIGVTDANGNTELLTRNEANKVTSHTAGDGTPYFINTTIDAFDNVTAVTSASGNTWQRVFDRKDKVTQVTLPSGDVWSYTLNENEFVTQITPPAGSAMGITRYAQGIYGDMSAHYLPMGEAHLYSHTPGHALLSHYAINIDGTTAYFVEWQRDFWDREIFKTDGSGSTYQTTYCPDGMPDQQLGVSVTGHGEIPDFDSTTGTFNQDTKPMPLKNITYAYLTSRRLYSITDANTARPQKLVKLFDINRNVVSITETNGAGNILRQTVMTYNALQLPVTQTDTNFSLNYYYDPAENRRSMQATYQPATGSALTHNGYWTYDKANRVLVNDGQLINGVIQSVFSGNFGYSAPSQGNTFDFENGLRESQSLLVSSCMGVYADFALYSAVFACNNNDMLSTITTTQTVVANYPSYFESVSYTPDGLFSFSNVQFWDPSAGTYDSPFLNRQIAYNLNGVLKTYFNAIAWFSPALCVTNLVNSAFNVDGYPLTSVLINSNPFNDPPPITDTLTNNFIFFDSSVITSTIGTRSDSAGTSTPVSFPRYYDSNNGLSSVADVSNPYDLDNPNPRTLFFDNSLSDGSVLTESVVAFDSKGNVSSITPTHYFKDGNDHIVAKLGTIVNSANQTETTLELTADPVKSFNVSDLSNEPNAIIQQGDTWKSISYRMYGGPDHESILQAYSGVPLISGQVINGRQTMEAYNKARNFTPYQKLMNSIYSSMNPALKTPQPPPPPPPHHESIFDEIIEAVVTVVVMVVAHVYLGPALFAGYATATGATAAVEAGVTYAAAGAIADAARQGVAIGLDDQHGFSMSEMFEQAMSSGLMAGFSTAAGIDGLLKSAGDDVLKYSQAFGEYVAMGIVVQEAEIAAGLRPSLDLKSIVEQAAAQVINAKLNNQLGSKTPKALAHGVDEFANTATDAAFGSPVDLTQMTGNYLGDEAADGAEYLGQQVKTQHASGIGKTNQPSSYAAKIHSVQTASRYISPESAANDPLYDLYHSQNESIRDDISEMDEASSATAQSFAEAEVEHHRAVRVQQHATRNTSALGFFGRVIHNIQRSEQREIADTELPWHVTEDVAENMVDSAVDLVKMGYHLGETTSFQTYLGLHSAAITSYHFAQSLLNPATRMQTVDAFEKGIGAFGIGLATKFEDDPLAQKIADGMTVFAAPEAGAVKGAELAGDAARGVGIFGRGVKSSTLNPYQLHVTHEMTMSKNEFRRLMDSVKANGIQQPIKYVEHQGKNYIVDGNHRMIAARHLGITNIPVKKVDLPYLGYKKPEDLYYYGGKF